jgi:hypothetical protein
MKHQNLSDAVGLIIRQKDPNNLEMPFDQLGDFITPAELFYIRSHFPTPQIDPVTYRLAIAGAVRSELRLSYTDIRAMPSRTCIATLECAGNGRVSPAADRGFCRRALTPTSTLVRRCAQQPRQMFPIARSTASSPGVGLSMASGTEASAAIG